MAYFAWMVVALGVIAATVYLVVEVSPWFILVLFAVPSLTGQKETK